MTAHDRVLAACSFKRPDRIPTYDSFWNFPDSWRAVLGSEEGLTDVRILCVREETFFTRAQRLKEEDGWIYEVEMWGRTIRRRPDGYFLETLAVPMPPDVDIDSVQFDSPALDSRYLIDQSDAASAAAELARLKSIHCVFLKTGGPYLRSTFVRGEEQYLTELAGDPPLARAIADKVGAYLTAIGLEGMKRFSLQDSGIWIFDDMAFNHGPMFRPKTFEEVLLPAYRRMISAYKAAGAKYVILHSDGDIRPILDMLIDAGIDGINPLERRAGMDPVALRKRYPGLILTGGMDNTDTLIHGPVDRVRAEARELIDLGRDGGVIIGTHSVSPEIPFQHFMAYRKTCLTHGQFEH